jgi:2-keto-3-deoxy-L-rhamnonate aldolase RhmA
VDLTTATAPDFRMSLQGEAALIGSVITLPDVALAELIARPLDLAWIDLEHGALSVGDVLPLTIAIQSAGCAALVRLACAGAPELGAILDAGVDGVVAPHVEDVEHAMALAARLRHPPDGTRGSASRRWNGYGLRATAAYPVLLAQIESRVGVERAGAIASVPGVDGLIVGYADLGAALGGDAKALAAAVARVEAVARGAGVAFGVAGPADVDLLARLGARASVIMHSADVRIIAAAVAGEVDRLRRRTEGVPR